MPQFRRRRSVVRAVAVGSCVLAVVLLAALGGGAAPALAVTRLVPTPTVVSADVECADLLPGSAVLTITPPSGAVTCPERASVASKTSRKS